MAIKKMSSLNNMAENKNTINGLLRLRRGYLMREEKVHALSV